MKVQFILFFLLAIYVSATIQQNTTCSWTCSSGDWTNVTCWDCGIVPNNTVVAVVESGTATISSDGPVNVWSLIVRNNATLMIGEPNVLPSWGAEFDFEEIIQVDATSTLFTNTLIRGIGLSESSMNISGQLIMQGGAFANLTASLYGNSNISDDFSIQKNTTVINWGFLQYSSELPLSAALIGGHLINYNTAHFSAKLGTIADISSSGLIENQGTLDLNSDIIIQVALANYGILGIGSGANPTLTHLDQYNAILFHNQDNVLTELKLNGISNWYNGTVFYFDFPGNISVSDDGELTVYGNSTLKVNTFSIKGSNLIFGDAAALLTITSSNGIIIDHSNVYINQSTLYLNGSSFVNIMTSRVMDGNLLRLSGSSLTLDSQVNFTSVKTIRVEQEGQFIVPTSWSPYQCDSLEIYDNSTVYLSNTTGLHTIGGNIKLKFMNRSALIVEISKDSYPSLTVEGGIEFQDESTIELLLLEVPSLFQNYSILPDTPLDIPSNFTFELMGEDPCLGFTFNPDGNIMFVDIGFPTSPQQVWVNQTTTTNNNNNVSLTIHWTPGTAQCDSYLSAYRIVETNSQTNFTTPNNSTEVEFSMNITACDISMFTVQSISTWIHNNSITSESTPSTPQGFQYIPPFSPSKSPTASAAILQSGSDKAEVSVSWDISDVTCPCNGKLSHYIARCVQLQDQPPLEIYPTNAYFKDLPLNKELSFQYKAVCEVTSTLGKVEVESDWSLESNSVSTKGKSPGNKTPWVIIGLCLGGGAIVLAVVVAVIIIRKRRGTHEHQPLIEK